VSGAIENTDTGGLISLSNGANPIPTVGGAAGTGVPGGQVSSFNEYNSPGISQKYPSFTATAQTQQPWGHTGIHVAVQDSRVTNLGGNTGTALGGVTTSNPTGSHIERWGYQVSETGHLNTWGSDKLTWNVEYGQGADGYAWDLQELGTQWIEDLVCSQQTSGQASNNSAAVGAAYGTICSQPRNWGLNLSYTHHWTDQWRSSVDVGYNEDSRPNAAADWNATVSGNNLTNLERRHATAFVNTYWTPVPGVQMGLEYQWWLRQVWSGGHGNANQLAFQTIFAF
jgi:hypothetical protein